jgi:hypothetical protein
MLRTKICTVLLAFVTMLFIASPQLALADVKSQVGSGVDAASGGSSSCTVKDANGNSTTGTPKQCLDNTIGTVVNILSSLVGVLAVIMIIIAGFRYVTSGGNNEAVGKAKNTILYAVIGLVVVASAQLIVRFVLKSV